MDRLKLHRFFSGDTTIEEGMEIKAWVESSKENEQLFYKERKLFDAITLHGHAPVPQRQPQRPQRVFVKWLKVAAIVTLTLALNHLYQVYQEQEAFTSMNTISVPAGQRTHVTLPDGTHVWLNARTTLQYPTHFSRKRRTVHLEGEAFFDVTSNPKKPFIVQAGDYHIEVLGTQFDVEAYPDMEAFETTLMKGSVKVSSPQQSILLKPKHKVYMKEGQLHVASVEDFDPYRWKEGLICFKDEQFPVIMKEFEKYYGIRIRINNPNVLKFSYTGKFRQADGVDYALRVLQRDIHFAYQKNNDEELIYIN